MDQQNRFKIVIPSYNNENWWEPNIASILNQTYTNYEVLYIDDCSTDNTYKLVNDIVKDLPNWKVVSNPTNMRRGYNLSPYNPLILDFIQDDEDILLFVDGDDWLYDEHVLEKINILYNQYDYWMTYGKFICYPTGTPGNPQNSPYPDIVHDTNSYRKDLWRASHLRTFKWHLYKQIKKEDLTFSQTGEFYFHAEDLATSFPCLEMCPKHKIGVVDFYTYVYNVSEEARNRVENDTTREPLGYKHEVNIRETEIRSKTPYSVLNTQDYIVTSIMAGGLGNMMFQVAAAYSEARRKGYTFLLNPNHSGTLHKAPLEYKDSIFKNIPLPQDSLNVTVVKEQSFGYNVLPFQQDNILLDGYFQSYKYFEEYQQEIRELFSHKVTSQYNPSGKVSLHVRRGNYVNLSAYHHNLNIEYYLNAINYFKGYEFLIFSDDIEWCKQTFTGEKFTFVEDTSDVEDLYLMSQCQHNIIANSTFSWWGAFLNSNPNKTVVYPNKWFGPSNWKLKTWDMFPPEWVCLTEESPQLTVNLFDNSFGHLTTPNGRYSSVHEKISSKIEYVRGQDNYEGITLFTDQFLTPNNIKSRYKIGWLLETREINPTSYTQFESYMNSFDFVLTHDKELLSKYPEKTKFTIFGGTWIKTNNYGLHSKNKSISMIYSNKTLLKGHRLRHEIANTVQGIDLYGKGTTRPIKYKEEALLDYRYSIVIENSKTDNYFTEKLIDCLLVGTIPIYWGCPNIDQFFDTEGMILINSLEDLQEVLGNLNESYYISKLDHINNNFIKAQKYAITEDWMYDNIFKNLI